MGRNQLHTIRLSASNLLIPTLNLHAANTTGINIIGCVYVNILGVDNFRQTWTTTQLCYVAKQITQLILSREACQQLGMIDSFFPVVGCANVKG